MRFVDRRGPRALACVMCAAALVVISACGGPGGPKLITGASIQIELFPTFPENTTSLGPGAAVNIQATVYDPSNQGVTWTQTPAAFGALSSETATSVTYTAPSPVPNSTTVTITATSISNPNVVASINIPTSPITILLAMPTPNGLTSFVPLPDQTLAAGGTLPIQALIANDGEQPAMTWTINGGGSLVPVSGNTLIDTTSSTVIYTAPPAVSGPSTTTVTATSVDGGVSASVRVTMLQSGGGSSLAMLNVDGGSVPGQVYRNGAFLNGVLVCEPGATSSVAYPFPVCQTVDGILLDTGSYGLRILQSAIPSIKLPGQVNQDGKILENCYTLKSGSYLWGPVATADLYVAGEYASVFVNPHIAALPVQVVSDSVTGGVPNTCSNGGEDLNTPQLLGANGILGIGPEPTDCTVAGANLCDESTQAQPPNIYYACPTSGCQPTDSPVVASPVQQVGNPIIAFGLTGAIVTFPPVTSAESGVAGTITFANLTSSSVTGQGATIYTLDSNDNFTTLFNGQTLTHSSINSGTNALLFPDTLPACSVNTSFFCPPNETNLTATVQGATQGQSVINFAVENADDLISSNPNDAAFGTLAGPGSANNFDWGLPFFYGRTVFEKVDACAGSPCDPLLGAWWAF